MATSSPYMSTATSAQYQTAQGSGSTTGDAEMRMTQEQWKQLLATQPQRFRVVDTYQTGGTSGEYGDVATTVGTLLLDGKPVGRYDQGQISIQDDMPDGQGGSKFTSFRAPVQIAEDGAVQSADVSAVDFRAGERQNRGNEMAQMLMPVAIAAGGALASGAGAGTTAAPAANSGAAEFASFQAADMAGAGGAVPASGAAEFAQFQAADMAGSGAGAGAGAGGAATTASTAAPAAAPAAAAPAATPGPTTPGPTTPPANSAITGTQAFQQLAARFGPAIAAQMLSGSNTLGLFQSTPDMDPSVGAATQRQTELASTLQGIGLDQYKAGTDFINRYSPVYDQIVNSNLSQGSQAGQLSSDAMQQWRTAFAPISDQYAKAVGEFGNDQAQRDAMIAATVQGQMDTAEGIRQRNLAASGVDPASGRNVQGGIDLANKTALAKVGAINADRANTRLQKVNVLGQGVQTGNAVAGLGLQAGNSALAGNQSATSALGQAASMRSAALQPASTMLGQASAANSGQVGQGISRYGIEAGAQGSAFRENAGTLGAIGGILSGLYTSSEKTKENFEDVDPEHALQGLRKVPVKGYDYKEGQGDGGSHVGPMAEDMQSQFGDGVAPGGKALDIQSQFGVHHAAIQALDKRITKLMKVAASGNSGAEDAPYRETSSAGVSLRSLRM